MLSKDIANVIKNSPIDNLDKTIIANSLARLFKTHNHKFDKENFVRLATTQPNYAKLDRDLFKL